MAKHGKTPVHILTGFLGSGKTTLLNRMLAAGAFSDTAVVVNELGEIGLDHLLVTERSGQVALLEGGCLCCAVVDSLPETLLELCRGRAAGELPHFSRIVIETTGLADPGPILGVLRGSSLLAHFLEAGVVVAALDMLTAEDVPSRYPEALRQLVTADRIVLTKEDLRGPVAEAERATIRAINPLAEIVSAERITAAPDMLIAPAPAPVMPAAARACDHAHHSHGVRAWSLPVPELVTRAGLAAFAAALDYRFGPNLLRCKGLVRSARGEILIQGVGSRFDFSAGSGLAGRIAPHVTCIVQGIERAEIAALLPWLHVPEGSLPPTSKDLA